MDAPADAVWGRRSDAHNRRRLAGSETRAVYERLPIRMLHLHVVKQLAGRRRARATLDVGDHELDAGGAAEHCVCTGILVRDEVRCGGFRMGESVGRLHQSWEHICSRTERRGVKHVGFGTYWETSVIADSMYVGRCLCLCRRASLKKRPK